MFRRPFFLGEWSEGIDTLWQQYAFGVSGDLFLVRLLRCYSGRSEKRAVLADVTRHNDVTTTLLCHLGTVDPLSFEKENVLMNEWAYFTTAVKHLGRKHTDDSLLKRENL